MKDLSKVTKIELDLSVWKKAYVKIYIGKWVEQKIEIKAENAYNTFSKMNKQLLKAKKEKDGRTK